MAGSFEHVVKKDRRTVYVEISDKIKEHLKSKWRDNQQFLSDFLDELSPEDLDSLERNFK